MLLDLLDSLLDGAEQFLDDNSRTLEPKEKAQPHQGYSEQTSDFLQDLGDLFSEIGEGLEDLSRDFSELGDMVVELGENAQTSLQNHLGSYESHRFESYALSQQNPPMLGDHLMTSRLGYTHHGLYAGNDLVLHYEKGSIHYDTLEAFQKNMDTYRLPEEESPISYPVAEVMERANSRLGEAQYQLIFNNCEHFVRWCRSGKESNQKSSSVLDDVEVIEIYECNETDCTSDVW